MNKNKPTTKKMTKELFEKFMEKNIVQINTLITVNDQELIIRKIDNCQGDYVIEAESMGYMNYRKYKLTIDAVQKISEMNPIQLAKAYDMKHDGSQLSTGKARGRPKKNRSLESKPA
jgi:hypothetical protein